MPPEPGVANDAGQHSLTWKVSSHSHVLARLRAHLGDRAMPPEVRAIAGNGTDDPSVALLDAFAVVADTVSFYTERIAQEGFLRTATELGSVRMLARTIGYELRPGVAAEVELAFDVEEAPGAPTVVHVAPGTPVQSIPAAEQLPQTFETSGELEARVIWNAVPGCTSTPAIPVFGDTDVWLAGTALGVRTGDTVLVVGEERRRFGRTPDHSRATALEHRNDERWEFRYVTGVEEPGGTLAGWTRVLLQRLVGWRRGRELTAMDDVRVWTFARRAMLFGAHAPDPSLIRDSTGASPTGTTSGDWTGIDDPRATGSTDVVEVDGDQARIVTGSWVVLEGPDMVELYGVEDVAPSGAARFGLSGKITRVRVDWTESLSGFGRRSTVVHCEPRPLPAAQRPVTAAVPDATARRTIQLLATDPPLPVGRTVIVTGFAPGTVPLDPILRRTTAPPQAEVAVVAACVVADGGGQPGVMTVTLDRDLALTYDPAALTVRGNIVSATHGERVEQVLGSGDATTTFQRMSTRRAPVTHLRATNASGAASTLQVRVDGVVWEQLESLDVAGPGDRALVARSNEDATVTVTAGDGVNGARLPTGEENVRASYRVGLGASGAMAGGQLTLLPRRPYGITAVTNPTRAHDWADPEAVGEARTNAPQRTRTLDRVVSTPDHQDFAAGFAGVSLARADAVWDGRETVVVVSVLGTAGLGVSAGLVSDLSASLVGAREQGSRFLVLPGELVRFGVRVDLAIDPAFVRADVEGAVLAALLATYAAPIVRFAAPVTAAGVLVIVRAVPGVLACTMPRLAAVTSAVGAGQAALGARSDDVDVLAPLPGRWAAGSPSGLAPAQAAAFVADGARIGVMVR